MSSPEVSRNSFVANLEHDDLPEESIDTVQRAFVDTVGVTLAESVDGAGKKTYRSAGIDSEEVGAAVLLRMDSDNPPAETALRLGAASHALD